MKKLIVVVDMQNDFIDGALGTQEAQQMLPKLVKKLEQEKEQQRVDLVCSQVRTKLDATRQELEKAHHETSSVERNYG